MKTSVFKRAISVVFAVIMLVGCISAGASAFAASNITINGVNIGYADGSYFTDNGKACSYHKNSSCDNCKSYATINGSSVYLGGSQCKGYAMYCQLKVYGYSEYSDSGKYTTNNTDYTNSSCSESNIKSALNGCKPATHVRTKWGHSIVIISTSSSDVTFTDVNWGHTCIVREESMSWSEFATWLKDQNGGVEYISQYNGSSSTPAPKPEDPPKTENVSFFQKIINFFKSLFSIFSIFK